MKFCDLNFHFSEVSVGAKIYVPERKETSSQQLWQLLQVVDSIVWTLMFLVGFGLGSRGGVRGGVGGGGARLVRCSFLN